MEEKKKESTEKYLKRLRHLLEIKILNEEEYNEKKIFLLKIKYKERSKEKRELGKTPKLEEPKLKKLKVESEVKGFEFEKKISDLKQKFIGVVSQLKPENSNTPNISIQKEDNENFNNSKDNNSNTVKTEENSLEKKEKEINGTIETTSNNEKKEGNDNEKKEKEKEEKKGNENEKDNEKKETEKIETNNGGKKEKNNDTKTFRNQHHLKCIVM
jgi:hypothetical protein